MGFMANIKAQKAYNLHGKGDLEGAKKLYEEAIEGGLDQPKFLISYAILLFRSEEYEACQGILRKAEKANGITADQKTQVFTTYAACQSKLGMIDKGINLLEKQHAHSPCGQLYQVLGYLYVEKYDRRSGDPEDMDAWNEGAEKAEKFILESIDYDDEDSICLDNMGQFLYRCRLDREKAKEWFEKAIAIKESQIDTLYFLSRYDLEEGNKDKAKERLSAALEGRFSPLNFANRKMVEDELNAL